MNILIVYSHPSEKSYTFEIFTHLKNILAAQKWNVEVSDLYANNFQGIMTATEYQREGNADTALPVPRDVIEEQQKN